MKHKFRLKRTHLYRRNMFGTFLLGLSPAEWGALALVIGGAALSIIWKTNTYSFD